MRENNRNSIASIGKLPQFTTMNVIDGQAGLVIYSSLIFYSLTIDNILNIVVLLILAAVTIASLSGDNGILSNATKAKKETEVGNAAEQIKLALSEWQIEKTTGTKGLQEYLEEKFEIVEDNGDGTYTVELDGYEAIVDENGNIVGEIEKEGPRPVVDETSIKITLEDGTTEPADGSLYTGTKLKVTFTSSIYGGEITSIEPVDGLTDGWQTEIEFTIIGTIDGKNRTSKKTISVAKKYHSEVIVPTIEKTGNFANNVNIAEVREGNIPIPTGFEYVKGDKQGGAVIRNTSATDSSEFVWVPVEEEKVTEMYGTLKDGTKAGKIYNWDNLDSNGNPANLNWTEATTDGKTVMSITSDTGLREPDTVSSCDGTADYLNIIKGILTNEQSNYADINSFKTTMKNDYKSMIESVEKYGRFYIARYEMSLNSETNKAQFIKNQPSATNATKTSGDKSYMWYGLYARAKEYSTSSTQGSMVWGSQYDAMLKWMKENNVNVTNAIPITGAVENTTRETGSVETDKILNIYDILGNSREWTLEACDTFGRARRGGGCYLNEKPSFRYGQGAVYKDGLDSTRATLYIK